MSAPGPTAGERECLICRRPEHEHRDRNSHGFVPAPASPTAGEHPTCVASGPHYFPEQCQGEPVWVAPAGEVWTDADIVYTHPDPPPAASTVTSEDVEALATFERLLGQWQRGEIPVDVLLSWLAAREAAARAEEREQIAQAIEAKVVHIHRSDYDRDGCDDGCGWLTFAARIAREG